MGNTNIIKPFRSVFTFSTLKRRIIFLLSVGILGCCILTAIVSYNAIYTMQQNRVKTAMSFELEQQSEKLTNTYNYLLQITQQLSPEGNVGSLVDEYLTTNKPYDRSVLSRNISSNIGLITFSNPNVELILYYNPDDGRVIFNDFPPRDSFSMETLPNLIDSVEITYQTPHVSQCRFSMDQVVSVTRRINFSNGQRWIIYVEANSYIATDFNTLANNGKMPYAMILLNREGQVRYSSDPKAFPNEQTLKLSGESGVKDEYIWNLRESKYGYKVALMVLTASYNQEIQTWKNQMFLILIAALLIMLLTAVILIKLIYKPLHAFEHEMEMLGAGDMDSLQYHTGIYEFDQLFKHFSEMKQQIQQLIIDVEQKEQRRHKLEIEKLAYQINPHFLMNALNSAHWLAVMNGQVKIDKFISKLNFILSYNLGKSQERTTLRTEIDVLNAYLELQQMRYEFEINLNIVEGEYLDLPIVRFILQPIVENAITHGLDEHGILSINITPDEGRRITQIVIHDDGRGFDAEALALLEQDEIIENELTGRGIGLRYVRSMLQSFYGDTARMVINSTSKQGTTVKLYLPY